MRHWNVRRSVVEDIEAETAEEAERLLVQRLNDAGFEAYYDDDFDVFESHS